MDNVDVMSGYYSRGQVAFVTDANANSYERRSWRHFCISVTRYIEFGAWAVNIKSKRRASSDAAQKKTKVKFFY